jgi:ATP-dependent helicase HrpB
VRLAVTLDAATVREAGAALLRTDEEVAWTGGDVVACQDRDRGGPVRADQLCWPYQLVELLPRVVRVS